jgi:acyl-CoA thioester hydrolase
MQQAKRGSMEKATQAIISTMTVHQTRLRVRYAETDQMGVVYYANYLVWMEVARVEFCKAAGFSYEQMEREDGIFLAVSEARCRYLYPARFDQEITAEASLSSAHPRMVHFAYEMRLTEDGRKLAVGETKHVFCGRDLRPVRLPEKYRASFGISVAAPRPR